MIVTILLLWGACFSSATRDLGNETDKLSLLAFKSQLTANPQNALSSWNDSLHVCEWEGIRCGHKHQRVTVLNLFSKALGGPISPSIGNMSFLRILRLSNNSFHGNIPQELGRLFRLETLSLSKNSLVGEIPGNISFCSNLKGLFLPFNNLTGEIPIELGSLAKLVTFNLEDNNFYGGIPPSLGNLTSLQVLAISRSNLGGNIPITFHLLRNLKVLDLNSCNLSGTFPSFLYSNLSAIETISINFNQLTRYFHTTTVINLPNLKGFYVGGNQLYGQIPISLFNASKLQRITLSINHFTGKVPPNVGNLQNLTDLLIGENNLGSAKYGDLDFFTSLTNCSYLQQVEILKNKFGGTLPASIGNFSTQFQQLALDENHIYGTIPPEVGNAYNLIRLAMSSNFFNDKIPMGIGNLQKLQFLDLSRNQLSGQIPSSMSNLSQLYFFSASYNNLGSIGSILANQNLQIADLSHNYFIGHLTKHDTRFSSRLIRLDVSYNYMSGSIPLEIGTLTSLWGLDFSHNRMSGEIHSTLGSCLSLEYLNLQGNFLHGPIPHSLSSIKGLQVLDLSSNNLSGEIPKELEQLVFLEYLNLSFNLLDGEVPLSGVFRNVNAFSISGNSKVCGGISQLKLPKCHVLKPRKHGSTHVLRVALGVVIPSFLVVLFLVMYLWKRPKTKPSSELCAVDLRRVSYIDLHKATKGFATSSLIGKGSYGSVYKGTVQQECLVAVKVLNLMEHGASKSFVRECEALGQLRHRNLLKILTVCSSADFKGNDFKALVFEFMANGSLENWLHPSSNEVSLPRSLNFNQRLTIAIDVASALSYLHNDSERPIVHCDVKPSNILLNVDMTACVGDFGLAKFLSERNNASIENETSSVAMRGTIGYIPPEYGMGAEVSKQGDVYSYGILLLEMFTGKRPTDLMFKDGPSLHDWCKAALPHRVLDIIDTNLSDKATDNDSPTSVIRVKECFSAIVRIGVSCSMERVDERMDIKQVLKDMHSVKELLLSVSSHENTSNFT